MRRKEGNRDRQKAHNLFTLLWWLICDLRFIQLYNCLKQKVHLISQGQRLQKAHVLMLRLSLDLQLVWLHLFVYMRFRQSCSTANGCHQAFSLHLESFPKLLILYQLFGWGIVSKRVWYCWCKKYFYPQINIYIILWGLLTKIRIVSYLYFHFTFIISYFAFIFYI